MADEFDPLKQTNSKASEPIYGKILMYFHTLLRIFMSLIATVGKTTTNSTNNDDDLLRSPFENILKLANNQTNQYRLEQQSNQENYHKLDFKNNAYKVTVRPSNPFSDEIREPPQSTIISPPSTPMYVNPPTPPLYVNPPSKPIYTTSSSQTTDVTSQSPPQAKSVVYEQQQKSDWNSGGNYHGKYSRIFFVNFFFFIDYD